MLHLEALGFEELFGEGSERPLRAAHDSVSLVARKSLGTKFERLQVTIMAQKDSPARGELKAELERGDGSVDCFV